MKGKRSKKDALDCCSIPGRKGSDETNQKSFAGGGERKRKALTNGEGEPKQKKRKKEQPAIELMTGKKKGSIPTGGPKPFPTGEKKKQESRRVPKKKKGGFGRLLRGCHDREKKEGSG